MIGINSNLTLSWMFAFLCKERKIKGLKYIACIYSALRTLLGLGDMANNIMFYMNNFICSISYDINI